ncbi:retinol dehydrogenase 13 [Stachybotrys elegans]|uniref:Retinol dehydrogenase 13 n=1 Tax=Stachybotrys elegans TaxID=80388 RepID=A0A8K0WKE8_9HYPO|nr:retinol dehydrogenase 13 [Stachybotrys elegans]
MHDQIASNTVFEIAGRYADHIKGKTVLITGVSPSSLAEAFVVGIAPFKPKLLVLTARDGKKVQQVADKVMSSHPDVGVRTFVFDISSLDAVRAAASEVKASADLPHVDVLFNNAGILAKPWATSTEGFEMQWATNYLGHFLFTNLIMDKILASPAPRVVMVTSNGHRLNPVRFDDYNFHDGESYNPWAAYGQSKTATSLLALALASKLGSKKNLVALSLHPGVCPTTNLYTGLDWQQDYAKMQELDRVLGNAEGWKAGYSGKMLSADECAASYVPAAFDSGFAKHNGGYVDGMELGDPSIHILKPWATSPADAERLWKLSEELVGQTFEY